ncbi:MAG: ATP-binding protein [Lysobacterales bacterium]
MRFTIALRLFVTVSLAFVAVAVVGVAAVRWRLFDAPPAAVAAHEEARLDALARTLALRYADHQDWSFLPAAAAARNAWLRMLAQTTAPGADAAAPNFEHRVGLLDGDLRPLAGALAHPAMVAFASIDRVRRPVIVAGATVGYVVLIKASDPERALALAFLVDQQGNLALIAALALGASALAALLLAWGFRRPIRQLVAGARQWQAANFALRLDAGRSDELGELARAFNAMAAALEAAERSRRQWVADTSHELRTPLAVLRAQIEALECGVRAATPEHLAVLHRQVLALTQLVDDLNALARADEGQLLRDWSPHALWPLLAEICAAHAERLAGARLTWKLRPAPAQACVRGDRDRLAQIISNLLENCIRYVPPGGHVEISGHVASDGLQVIVEDSGPGVPAELLPRLGERFFRVEPSRDRAHGGSGLGLALATRIARAHGGQLRFSASPLGGLRATLTLPGDAGA